MTSHTSDSINQPNSKASSETMRSAENCANPRCKCAVANAGDYCGEECEDALHTTQKFCSCGHRRVCRLECDLVMKGGITSGIVYPPLVSKLKDRYYFRNVGGTSAGAISAAATAAAEYGRHKLENEAATDEAKKDDECGFEGLKKVNEQLREPDFLLNLFQPKGQTRPVLETALALLRQRNERKEPPLRKGRFRSALSFISQITGILQQTEAKAYRTGARRGVLYAVTAAFVVALMCSAIFLVALLLASPLTPGAALRVALVGLLLLFILCGVVFSLAGHRAGGLAAALLDLYVTLKEMGQTNFFGICNGRSGTTASGQQSGAQQEALTDWLHTTINKLAGRSSDVAPLTFGDLWEPRDAKGNKRIDLRMMTSNLSQNQPYVLPFEQNLFIFKKSDFETLFPPAVVRHMIDHHRKCIGLHLPEGFYFLPAGKDLPIIVATRMSLSFPLLISMVPLYTISHAAFGEKKVRFDYLSSLEVGEQKECIAVGEIVDARLRIGTDPQQWPRLTEKVLQPNWFSDGGICSNFPMHFFDAWLPTRPTFGVNLTSQLAKGTAGQPPDIKKPVPLGTESEGTESEKADKQRFSYVGQQTSMQTNLPAADRQSDEKAIYLAKPDSLPSPEWIPITNLTKFLAAVFRTAQNYRDNMQAMLPSYRERIVQIRLTDVEGGLNLNMGDDVIKRVIEKGEMAGEALLNEFDFEVHQWVRFRVLMKQMEQSLAKMTQVMSDCEFYLQALKVEGSNPPRAAQYPYARDSGWCVAAEARLKALNKLIAEWKASTPSVLFAEDSPLPDPVLRVTPEL